MFEDIKIKMPRPCILQKRLLDSSSAEFSLEERRSEMFAKKRRKKRKRAFEEEEEKQVMVDNLDDN